MRDFADRVIVTRSGSIVEKGPVRRVFGVPHHPCPRALLAARLDPAARPSRPPATWRTHEAPRKPQVLIAYPLRPRFMEMLEACNSLHRLDQAAPR